MAHRRNLRSNGPVNPSPVPAARNQRSTRSAVKSAKGAVEGVVAGRKSRPLPRKLTKQSSDVNAIGTDESFLSNCRWSKRQSGDTGNEIEDASNEADNPQTPPQSPHSPRPESPAPQTPHSPHLQSLPPALSSGFSSSDFSADENRKHAEFEKRYAKCSDHPRMQEEDDISDEEHFIQDALNTYSDVPSRASEGIQEHAHELYKQFQEGIQGLAKECGKSTDVIFNIVGYGPRVRHRPKPNRWSAFLAHYSVYGERKKPKDMSASDWTIELQKEYQLLIKQRLGDEPDTPTNRDKCLEDILEWYQNAYDDFVDKKKVSGKFKGIINKSLGEFMQLVRVRVGAPQAACGRISYQLGSRRIQYYPQRRVWGVAGLSQV
ncbi:hypothetical protein H0H92_006450 [Tricholoma furcatifolium]|nr:hypothetical protein H0H92_006450 [Tricholoma furcatifolium]